MTKRIILVAVAIIGVAVVYASNAAEERADHDRVRAEQREMRDAVKERLGAMRGEIAELREQGHHDEAKRLARKARQLAGEHQADAPRLEKRVDDLRRQAEELHDRGAHEDAEHLERKARELAERLESDPRRGGDRGAAEELGRRIHHLEIAIENLRAAGMHEPAEHLERQLNELRRAREQHAQRAERAERDRPQADGHLAELHHTVRDLRAEVQELRQIVEELRGRVDRLSAER